MYKELLFPLMYNLSGMGISRIRIKLENNKSILLWTTIQLEGLVLGKWLPLIRYDFDPKDKMPVHINKEYISTDDKKNKTPFNCNPKDLTSTAFKLLVSMQESEILELIEKRKKVLLEEGR